MGRGAEEMLFPRGDVSALQTEGGPSLPPGASDAPDSSVKGATLEGASFSSTSPPLAPKL